MTGVVTYCEMMEDGSTALPQREMQTTDGYNIFSTTWHRQEQQGLYWQREALLPTLQTRVRYVKRSLKPILIDCIVNLPAKLFLNTQIPASIWFMKRGRTTKDILFIDSRNMGELINRRTKEFSSDDTDYIASVYHNGKNNKEYEDIKGFCKSASLDEVRELNYVLTPGRYVGLEEVDDEFDFKERFPELQKELQAQMEEEQTLNKRINENLARVAYE